MAKNLLKSKICKKLGLEAAFINLKNLANPLFKFHMEKNFEKLKDSSDSHYDSTVGRWTTKDPIGFNGGDTNLYAYVGGNPMSYVDPSGLAGIFGNYGGQITAPGGGATITTGAFVGSNAGGGISAGINGSAAISAASSTGSTFLSFRYFAET